MSQFTDLIIEPNQQQALGTLKTHLLSKFAVEAIILFGSVARNEADEESDLDLLILTKYPLTTRFERHEITDAIFDINLAYDTNISSLVVDKTAWERGAYTVLPIYDEIRKDGILL